MDQNPYEPPIMAELVKPKEKLSTVMALAAFWSIGITAAILLTPGRLFGGGELVIVWLLLALYWGRRIRNAT